jgi:uncharacterized protein (DUF2147 family)
MLRTALVFTLLASAAPAAAADVTGVWMTPTKHGEVEITRCGQSICGRLMTSDGIKADPNLKDVKNQNEALRSRPLKGVPLLQGFKGGPNEWTDGKIYNPDDGKTYGSSLKLEGADTLKVKGCIVAPLCKTQTWKRIR